MFEINFFVQRKEKENPRSFFRFSFRATFDKDQDIYKVKLKVALNEKNYVGFLFL